MCRIFYTLNRFPNTSICFDLTGSAVEATLKLVGEVTPEFAWYRMVQNPENYCMIRSVLKWINVTNWFSSLMFSVWDELTKNANI